MIVIPVTHDLNGNPDHAGCKVYWAIHPERFIIGICHVLPGLKSVLVSDLSVDPEMRRQKIGSSIINQFRKDYHPKQIRGNAAPGAVDFWVRQGAKLKPNNDFVINPDW